MGEGRKEGMREGGEREEGMRVGGGREGRIVDDSCFHIHMGAPRVLWRGVEPKMDQQINRWTLGCTQFY